MEDLKELRKETIEKLEEVKNNLSYDMQDNYTNMINTMIDYDNEAQDTLYLSDKVNETMEIVDDELLEYYLQQNNDPQRLFYATAGLEFADDIYKINAYGNLENVESSDFEYCIDDAIDSLKDAIERNE